MHEIHQHTQLVVRIVVGKGTYLGKASLSTASLLNVLTTFQLSFSYIISCRKFVYLYTIALVDINEKIKHLVCFLHVDRICMTVTIQ